MSVSFVVTKEFIPAGRIATELKVFKNPTLFVYLLNFDNDAQGVFKQLASAVKNDNY